MNSLLIRSTGQNGFPCAAALVAVLLLVAGGPNALANTMRCVPSLSVNPGCAPPAYSHIQDAVTAAAPGDVIVVGPGTYNESVYIGTSNLSIFGAQTGEDARVGRDDPSKESIVDASGTAYGSGGGAGFFVDGNYIIIDGFTIHGGTAGPNASAIYVEGPYSAHILDNIIQKTPWGYFCTLSFTPS